MNCCDNDDCGCYSQGFEDGLGQGMDELDITPTYDDGYQEALEDVHAAISALEGTESVSLDRVLDVIEDMLQEDE